MEVGPGPGHIVLDGAHQPPSFWPMSIAAKLSPISAIAEHLLTEGATYIPRAAITLGIGPHSSHGRPM